MPLEITDRGPALSATAVAGLERRMGVKLPPEYRSFLLTHNGGKFNRDVVCDVAEPPGGVLEIRRFFPIRSEKGKLVPLQTPPEPPETPTDGVVLVIAQCAWGVLGIGCHEREAGRVYFIAPDRGVRDWFYLVANTFSELLLNMRINTEK